MAIDNLNYYSSGLPAWQQTDKYSSQPWFLKSKNLDIFSSSKSVKGTAWSEPVDVSQSWVVLVDQTWNLILKTDWNVYDISSWEEVLVKAGIASNFPSYNVSYNGELGTYAPAQWGTEKQLISKYENGVLKYFTIFTDRASYSYSVEKYRTPDSDNVWTSSSWNLTNGDMFKKSDSSQTTTLRLSVNGLKGFTTMALRMQAMNSNYATEWTITITRIVARPWKYYYNAETEQMEGGMDNGQITIDFADNLDCITGRAIDIPLPLVPNYWSYNITITLRIDPPEWSTNYNWRDGELFARFRGYNDYYNYLPVVEDRELKEVWEYYWEKWVSNQTLYSWNAERKNNSNYERVVVYNLEKYMAWTSDVSMDVIWMTARNEQVYMIGNMNWNWYIIPCDLSWWRGTPYIAYWCTFRWVTNIDYLMYLVWEDRGISQLWVFNWQELVAIVWWNEENTTKNLTKTDEQYRFDWKMVEYRWDLVLSTTDNKIFQYGQTYGGKWGAFIHQLPWNITDLKVRDNDLSVDYSVTENNTTTKYSTTYQDDKPIKRYNTEWVAEYPIVLWNPILEKEESDLYCSYILPSADTSLEFWGMANHYHFWTFTSSDTYTFSTDASYKLKWCTGDYSLKFVEKNDNQYTFRLEGDLPVQNWNDMKITDTEWAELITYTEYNHFRKIWEITTDKYQEWEFRFHNLNNKLELPKSHSLQIMVKGKGTVQYTPELFGVNLIANQRDRW